MDKLKMHKLDMSQENIAKIRALFPGCVREARDLYYRLDKLMQSDLTGRVDNINPDRTLKDLLFQVLVDWAWT